MSDTLVEPFPNKHELARVRQPKLPVSCLPFDPRDLVQRTLLIPSSSCVVCSSLSAGHSICRLDIPRSS